MEHLLTVENLTALLTLTLMEIVLGLDNLIFIAILASKLPQTTRFKARALGVTLALFFRIALLFSLKWVMGLTLPLFSVFEHSISGRDAILILGGLFLVAKATIEIHQKLIEGFSKSTHEVEPFPGGFTKTVIQIMMIDILFSIDSVITAVGMAKSLAIMIAAVILSMLIMLWMSGPIANFIDRNPTLKFLALSFLILIGAMLVAEGMGASVSKSYIYFAMAFAASVELINIRYRKK